MGCNHWSATFSNLSGPSIFYLKEKKTRKWIIIWKLFGSAPLWKNVSTTMICNKAAQLKQRDHFIIEITWTRRTPISVSADIRRIGKTDISVSVVYTTNPHERLASNGRASCLPSARRATTEQPSSACRAKSLSGRSVVVGISGVMHADIHR